MTNLVIGKGKVYFDQFAPGTKTGTGERYMGNTPEFNISQDQSTLDHYDSDSGLNVKDESVVTEQNMTGTLITDHIVPENVGLWFGADVDKTTVTAAIGLIETKAAKLGTFVQLGTTEDSPTGARNIANLVVKIGAATVVATANYEVDLALGRVYLEIDAAGIVDGDAVIYTYDVSAGVRTQMVARGTNVAGAVRFISANPVGGQTDYFFPYVKLTANGDFALKGEEWQQVPFAFEALKKDAVTERVYIDGRAVV